MSANNCVSVGKIHKQQWNGEMDKMNEQTRPKFKMARISQQLHFRVKAFSVKSAGRGSSILLQILQGVSHSHSGESMCFTQLDAKCQSVAASQSNYYTPVVNKRRVNILFGVNSFSCPDSVHGIIFIWGEKRKFLWEAPNRRIHLLLSKCWYPFFFFRRL